MVDGALAGFACSKECSDAWSVRETLRPKRPIKINFTADTSVLDPDLQS